MPKRFLLLLLILPVILFAFLIPRDFSGPLGGPGDTDIWEYCGYYFSRNLSFSPLPHLDLHNNQSFYPYGTNQVFQPWSLEREYFFSFFYSFWGPGPWLQVYYLISVLITFWGAFFLLKKDYGNLKAYVSGFILTFANFYALNKYPYHLNISVCHWTSLSLITDFLICKKLTNRDPLSLLLVIFRITLLFLSLGQDLGYVAGFSLLSFTVNLGFILYNKLSSKSPHSGPVATGPYKGDKDGTSYISFSLSSQERVGESFFLLLTSLILAFLYLPLILEIMAAVKQFPAAEMAGGVYWANPLRLFIPILPFAADGLPLADVTESGFDGRPGLFLVIAAAYGLWLSRKSLGKFIPLIIVFLFCLLYHPVLFPILKIFPWFSLNRVAGRSTLIYPVILVIFSLEGNWRKLLKKPAGAGIVLLAIWEFLTAYGKFDYYRVQFTPDFFAYQDYVRRQPGEAVLDLPFCVAGGNGVATEKLCPYYSFNSSVFTYKRFHQKKVPGHYFGRLHPSQVEPFFAAGWDKLFLPDQPELLQASKQARCFNQKEWQFLRKFFILNDFSGINLYTGFFSKSCAEEFYRNFGQPVIATEVPGAGRLEFIPKAEKDQGLVNREAGKTVKFSLPLNFSESNLVKFNRPQSISLEGISLLEPDASIRRWSQGWETRFSFNSPEQRDLNFRASLLALFPEIKIKLAINNQLIKEITIEKNEFTELSQAFTAKKGENRITLSYDKFYTFPEVLKEMIREQGYSSLINLPAVQKKYRQQKNKAVGFRDLEIRQQ